MQEAADLTAIDNGLQPDKLQTSALTAISTATTVATGLAAVSGPAALPYTVGAWAVTEISRNALTPPVMPEDLQRLDSVETGDWDVQYLVANAAALADYQDPPTVGPLPRSHRRSTAPLHCPTPSPPTTPPRTSTTR